MMAAERRNTRRVSAYNAAEVRSAMNSVRKARICGAILMAGVGALLAARPAPGQNATELQRAEVLLPAPSRNVVEQLLGLAQLPAGPWKMHAGDLAHGESVRLDDSGWQTIAPGASTSKDAVWFRLTVQIPVTLRGYDLTGARIWFQFRADANGPVPEILYFDGRRVAAGEDLEPIVLLDNVRTGDKVAVAVKLPQTVDAKTFRGASLHIEFPQGRPNPEDLALEFLSAAELIPSLAPGDSGKLGTLNAALAEVNLKALEAAEIPTARAANPKVRVLAQEEFDLGLKLAHEKLAELRPLLETATFHLTGNSHIDAAWLWPWTETVDVVHRTFGTALLLMNEVPGYTYTQSTAAYNDWMAQKYPSLNNQIKQRIQEGRWEVAGGMWVEPDLNMPDGESLVRQLLVGKRWFKQAYGVDVRVGWNPDSFGYTWQLPQIYKKSGIDYFVTQKMAWNDTNQLPLKLFWWQSPDGSKVLAYFPRDYANTNLSPVRLSEDLAAARERAPGLTEMMDLYGVGDHGGGPTRTMLDEGFHWARGSQAGSPCLGAGHDLGRAETASMANRASASGSAAPGKRKASGRGSSPAANAPATAVALAPAEASSCPNTPKFEFGTAQSFFSTIEKQIAPSSPAWNYQSIAKGYTPPASAPGKASIPTWDSELYFEYHRGVFTTQANQKRNMRTAEEEMLNAEKWSSLAWLAGKSYPADELTEDWKKVLFNQFHDLAAGSGIGVIYQDAQKDYDYVRLSTNEISAGALQAIMEQIDTAGSGRDSEGPAIVVFNPLAWTRSADIVVKAQLPSPASKYAVVDSLNGKRKLPDGTEIGSVNVYSNLISQDQSTGVAEFLLHLWDIPAFGYKVLHVVPESALPVPPPPPRAEQPRSDFVLHGANIDVAVDKDSGCITSIRDTGSNFEMLAPRACGNELQFFMDTPKQYDAWNIDPGTLDVPPMTIHKADLVEFVGGDAIRVTRRWQNSKFVQTIRLDGDIVDIENDIDWHEMHILLKAAFPLAVTSNFATYEIPYGAIERPTTRNNSWEKAQFEVPAMRWADLSSTGPDGKVHGLSILNQDKYGYDAVGNVLRLTLLRSPTWPDPEADQGHHHFHFALYPHAGTWKDAMTVRRGWEYNYPLQAVVTAAHAGSLPAERSFASVEPDNVVLTAVKKAEDANGLILRVYEWAGKEATAEFHVPPSATGATVTNLMEQPEGDPLAVTGNVVKIPIHPYEILTIRVDYPKAGSRD